MSGLPTHLEIDAVGVGPSHLNDHATTMRSGGLPRERRTHGGRHGPIFENESGRELVELRECILCVDFASEQEVRERADLESRGSLELVAVVDVRVCEGEHVL